MADQPTSALRTADARATLSLPPVPRAERESRLLAVLRRPFFPEAREVANLMLQRVRREAGR